MARTSVLTDMVVKLITNGKRRSAIDDSFKLTNSDSFLVYDGEKVEMSYEEEISVRNELSERFGGGSRYGSGEGTKLIMILAIIFAEIIIIFGLIVPAIQSTYGVDLVHILLIAPIAVLVPALLIVNVTNSYKTKAELREAIASGYLELFDYVVSDKLENSDKYGTSYYVFIGDVSIKASSLTYHSVNKGDKLRCALADAKGGRFIMLMGKSPSASDGSAEKKPASAEELFNSIIMKHGKNTKKF